MGEKAEYRNAIRSRNLIRKAFVELLHEKGLGHVTVTDIVTRADINRGTFYAHYRDARAVLSQIEDEIIAKMNALIDECNEKNLIRNPLPILSEVGRFLEKDLELYRALITSSGCGPFLQKLRAAFVDRMMGDSRIRARYRDRSKFFVTISFFAGGMVSLYQDWFARRIDKSLEEVAATVCELNPYKAK